MSYVHYFDYSFLDKGMIPASLMNVTAEIYSIRALSWDRKEQFADIFTALESVARIQSVKSSNEIGGIVTTDDRIAQIVGGNSSPLNHNEREIAGYRDALAQVHTGYTDIGFDERGI